VGGKYNALAALPPGKRADNHVHEAGWALGLVWMDAENFTPHHVSIPGLSSVTNLCTYYADPARL